MSYKLSVYFESIWKIGNHQGIELFGKVALHQLAVMELVKNMFSKDRHIS
jgi:hypothetical protein